MNKSQEKLLKQIFKLVFAKRKHRNLAFILVASLILAVSIVYQPIEEKEVLSSSTVENPSNEEKTDATAPEKLYKVARIVDGDTIELEDGRKVRYIGINTPESVKSGSPVECYAKDASARNKELVEGKLVRLEKDISDTDRYGRLLRYVYVVENSTNENFLSGSKSINAILVSEGFANASAYPPDVKYQEVFEMAELEAKNNERGLWGSCDY